MVDTPVLKTGLFALIERQLNAALSLDSVVYNRLSGLHGCVVRFQCNTPPLSCFIHFEHEHIRVAGFHEGVVDAAFSGALLAFTELVAHRTVPFSDIPGLSVSGDEAVLRQLQVVHSQFDMDWESLFCRKMGDVPGYLAAQGIRFAGQHISRGKQMFEANLGAYLQEELRVIPAEPEVNVFVSDVASLELDLQRIEQKVFELAK